MKVGVFRLLLEKANSLVTFWWPGIPSSLNSGDTLSKSLTGLGVHPLFTRTNSTSHNDVTRNSERENDDKTKP